MSYRDICFCKQSKKGWAESDKPLCKNKKCDRHAANIPFERLPEWERYSISDFSEKCGKYKG